MGQVSANVKDSSTSANVPVDGVSVAAAGAAITGGQALRNCFVLGKSDGTANWADPDGAGNLNVNLKTAIPAGGNLIGNVGGAGTAGTPSGGVITVQGAAAGTQLPVSAHTISARILVTPTLASGAYTPGLAVCPLLTFANAFGAATTGVLQSISIAIKSTQTATFNFYTFISAPTAPVANTAYAISTADAAKILGVYTLSNADSGCGANSTIYNLDGIGAQIDSSSTSLFAILMLASGTPTFTTTSDMIISVGVLQD
jgi:hypothetical protein